MSTASTTTETEGVIDGARAAAWLGGLRFLIFTIWGVKAGCASLATFAWLPAEIFEPPLILQALPASTWSWLLRPHILDGLQIVLCVLSLLAAVGVRPYRPIAIVAAALITFEQALVRSWGISTHPEMLALLATWIVTLSPAADGFVWPVRKYAARPAAVYVATIAFVAVVGCWTYTATAAYRVAHHGVEMFTSSSMKYFIVYNSFTHGSGANAQVVLEHPTLASSIQLCLPVATVLEVAAPLALIFSGFRRLWLVFLVLFQLAIEVSMSLFFWESTLILVVALVAFDRVAPAKNVKVRWSEGKVSSGVEVSP